LSRYHLYRAVERRLGIIADESVEHSDPSPERSDEPARGGASNDPRRSSNRRRVIITSLLTPPAVMTLNARSGYAGGGGKGSGGGGGGKGSGGTKSMASGKH
jgi:hypothetical protein